MSRVRWIGDTNISAWLLEQGWANVEKAEIDGVYLAALARAKAKRVGLWSD